MLCDSANIASFSSRKRTRSASAVALPAPGVDESGKLAEPSRPRGCGLRGDRDPGLTEDSECPAEELEEDGHVT